MRTQIFTSFVVALALSGVACGGAATTPALTSASVLIDPTATSRMAEMQVERDHARRDAEAAKASAEAQAERSEKAQHALAARNAFESNVWARIERLEARLAKGHASPTAARGFADRLETVERETHRVHAVPQVEWETFTSDIGASLDAISRDVEKLQPGVATGAKATR